MIQFTFRSSTYSTFLMAALAFLLAVLVSPVGADTSNRISTLRISPTTSPEYLRIYANIEPINQATMYAQTSGTVVEMNVDVNDRVEKGALLIKLDPQQQLASVKEAQALLREAQANQANAQKQYRRIKKLVSQRSLPQSKLDNALALLEAANARIQQVTAAKKRAKEQLSYTNIIAPYSGVVTARHIEIGELALPGKPLISGFSLNQLRVAAAIPQRYIDQVRAAKEIKVTVNQTPITLHAFTLFPYADPQSHSYQIRANLPEGIPHISPGMLVKIAIPLNNKQGIWIPTSAVLTHNELNTVYLVDKNQHVQLQQIRIGQRTNMKLEVIAGLREGDRILTHPHIYLDRLNNPIEANRE